MSERILKIKTILLLSILLTVISSIAIADQSATTKDGKEVLLKDDGLWQYITPLHENIKYAENAVGVWDKSLTLHEGEYSNKFVALQLHYRNNTEKKIIGVTVFISIKNPFGKVVSEDTYEDEVIIAPNEQMRNDTFWRFEDNPFIDGQPFDLMWQMAKYGTAQIETKILKVIFEDGNILESNPKNISPSLKKNKKK